MPFRPTLLRRCPHDSKLTSFLSVLTSFAASPSTSPPAGSVPAALTPAAYNALMSAYSRAGRPEEVLRLFRSLPFPPTAPLFTTLISSLAASGRPLAARAAFCSLLVSGITPTVSSFTALINSRDALLDSMYQVFLAMEAAGCRPDAAVYNCHISVLCASGRLEEARGFLDLMLQEGVRPTVRSYTAMLRGYCEQGKILEAERMGFLDEAFHQVDIMLSRGLLPTVETVNILFDCLCRDSRFSDAVCLLEHSEELGWYSDVFCYNTLMGRLCDVGDFSRVFKLLVDLVKKGIGPDMFSFTIAIRALCGAGRLKVAKCLIDNECIGYDVVTFNTLIHGFCTAGDLRGVKLTYIDMVNRKVSPNNFTNAMLIESLCKDRKFVEAINTLASLRDGLVPDHLVHLDNLLVKGIKFTKVLNLLDEIRHRGFVLDICIFIPLVRVLCWEGYYQRENINEVSLILTNLLGIR